MTELVLLTRPDCALCEEFCEHLLHWAGDRELPPLQRVDVDSDPLLQRRYGLQIPVLLLDGVKVCATQFVPEELERLLRARANH